MGSMARSIIMGRRLGYAGSVNCAPGGGGWQGGCGVWVVRIRARAIVAYMYDIHTRVGRGPYVEEAG